MKMSNFLKDIIKETGNEYAGRSVIEKFMVG